MRAASSNIIWISVEALIAEHAAFVREASWKAFVQSTLSSVGIMHHAALSGAAPCGRAMPFSSERSCRLLDLAGRVRTNRWLKCSCRATSLGLMFWSVTVNLSLDLEHDATLACCLCFPFLNSPRCRRIPASVLHPCKPHFLHAQYKFIVCV